MRPKFFAPPLCDASKITPLEYAVPSSHKFWSFPKISSRFRFGKKDRSLIFEKQSHKVQAIRISYILDPILTQTISKDVISSLSPRLFISFQEFYNIFC